jgi:hypothetical protein
MTLNSTSMAPAAINLATGYARVGGVKHQVKPMCQRSVGVGQSWSELVGAVCDNFLYRFKGALTRARPAGWPQQT